MDELIIKYISRTVFDVQEAQRIRSSAFFLIFDEYPPTKSYGDSNLILKTFICLNKIYGRIHLKAAGPRMPMSPIILG